MYRSFSQLREGWTKNLVLLFPSPVWLAIERMTEFLLIVGGVASAFVLILHGSPRRALLAAAISIVLEALLLRRIRRAHFAWQASILSLAGLPLFSYLLLRSILAHKKGRVSWKGRDYTGDTSSGPAFQSVSTEPKPGWQAPV